MEGTAEIGDKGRTDLLHTTRYTWKATLSVYEGHHERKVNVRVLDRRRDDSRLVKLENEDAHWVSCSALGVVQRCHIIHLMGKRHIHPRLHTLH